MPPRTTLFLVLPRRHTTATVNNHAMLRVRVTWMTVSNWMPVSSYCLSLRMKRYGFPSPQQRIARLSRQFALTNKKKQQENKQQSEAEGDSERGGGYGLELDTAQDDMEEHILQIEVYNNTDASRVRVDRNGVLGGSSPKTCISFFGRATHPGQPHAKKAIQSAHGSGEGETRESAK